MYERQSASGSWDRVRNGGAVLERLDGKMWLEVCSMEPGAVRRLADAAAAGDGVWGAGQ
ncbi:MAG TPA: hypothetical protein VN690_01070 [Terriglobales bacterium]|nr:hypothetical protein [Terriglobales bacterium]